MRNKTPEAAPETARDIIDGLRAMHAQAGSWRVVGHAIGVSSAYARLLANGERVITQEIAAAWRRWQTGEVLLHVPTPACPSCLREGKKVVHAAGDCHGRPVEAVVCLAPGEKVVQTISRRKLARKDTRVTIHVSRETLAQLRALRGNDKSDDAVLRRLFQQQKELI